MVPYRYRLWLKLAGAAVLGLATWGIYALATAPSPPPAPPIGSPAICHQVAEMNLSWVSSELNWWVDTDNAYLPNSELAVFNADGVALGKMSSGRPVFDGDLHAAGVMLTEAAADLWNTPDFNNGTADGGKSGDNPSWRNALNDGVLDQVQTDCG